jgi:BRCT domain type II-containing protein
VQQVLRAALEATDQQQPATPVDAGAATAAAAATTPTSETTTTTTSSSSSSRIAPLSVSLDAATTAVLLPHLAHLGAASPPSFLEDAALQALLPLVRRHG